jgi:hypothetical protein
MWRRVAFITTDGSEESIATNIRVERINELWTTETRSVIRSTETSVLTTATLRDIPEDVMLRSHHCENLKSDLIMEKYIRICLSYGLCLEPHSSKNDFTYRPIWDYTHVSSLIR